MAIRVNYQPDMAVIGNLAQLTGQGQYRQYADQIQQAQLNRDIALQEGQRQQAAAIADAQLRQARDIADGQFRQAQQIGAADRQQQLGIFADWANSSANRQFNARQQAQQMAYNLARDQAQMQYGAWQDQQRLGAQLWSQQQQSQAQEQGDIRRARLAAQLSDRQAEQRFLAERGINPSVVRQFDAERRRIDELAALGQLSPQEQAEAIAQIGARRDAAIMNSVSQASPYPQGQGIGDLWQMTDPAGQAMAVGDVPVMMTRDQNGVPQIVRGFSDVLNAQKQQADRMQSQVDQQQSQFEWATMPPADRARLWESAKKMGTTFDSTTGFENVPNDQQVMQILQQRLGVTFPNQPQPAPANAQQQMGPVATTREMFRDIIGASFPMGMDLLNQSRMEDGIPPEPEPQPQRMRWSPDNSLQQEAYKDLMHGSPGYRTPKIVLSDEPYPHSNYYEPIPNPRLSIPVFKPALKAALASRIGPEVLDDVPPEVVEQLNDNRAYMREKLQEVANSTGAAKQIGMLEMLYGKPGIDDRHIGKHNTSIEMRRVLAIQKAIADLRDIITKFGTDPKNYSTETKLRWDNALAYYLDEIATADQRYAPLQIRGQ